MLSTCKEYNPVNCRNYTIVRFPAKKENEDEYVYLKIHDFDNPSFNDQAFEDRVGSKAVWELWTYGRVPFMARLSSVIRGQREMV